MILSPNPKQLRPVPDPSRTVPVRTRSAWGACGGCLGMLALACLCLSWAPASAEPAAAWVQGQGYRFRELNVPVEGRAHLTEVPSAETGITFRYDVPEERGAENSIRL